MIKNDLSFPRYLTNRESYRAERRYILKNEIPNYPSPIDRKSLSSE